MKSVRAFIGTARAAPANDGGYTPGELRKVIVLLRQEEPGEHDWARANAEIERRGWVDVRLERGSRVVDSENLNAAADYLKAGYADAVTSGSSLIVYKAIDA